MAMENVNMMEKDNFVNVKQALMDSRANLMLLNLPNNNKQSTYYWMQLPVQNLLMLINSNFQHICIILFRIDAFQNVQILAE